MFAALAQDLLHPVFLAHVPLPEKLDLDSVLRSQPFSILAKLIAVRVRKARVVEDPHLVRKQVGRHPLGVANPRQSAEHQHPVPTTQHPLDLRGVPLGD